LRKISAIIPVYNEEKLLPLCLNGIKDHVDEIIIVDGGPAGPSTDNTKSISESCDKVKYLSGTFKTIPGAWDSASQKNIGIMESTGDVIIPLSADVVFSDFGRLSNFIRENEQLKVFFCPLVEFWMDMEHMRMYGPIGKLSLPAGAQEAIAISKAFQPMATEYGNVDISTMPKPDEQVMVSDVIKFHLGWIRSFPEQVSKHIRHVRQGLWGDDGAKLLNSTEQKLEQWAILHVLNYIQPPCIPLKCELPEGLNEFRDMQYLQGQEAIIQQYHKKYGTSPFRGATKE
jgi:glycosyltransferase involved in cell wall biosynthesis